MSRMKRRQRKARRSTSSTENQMPNDIANGFVRPFWQAELQNENGHPMMNGIRLNDLDTVNRHFSSRAEGEKSEANGFLANHQQRLENAMLNAVREFNLLALEVTLNHYLELLNLDGFYENDSLESCDSSKPINFLPLIVAAQLGNNEAINLFLSKGFEVQKPHNVLCKCEECMKDEFKVSQQRLDIYRALANPVYISNTSKDPFSTTFKLSTELEILSRREDEYEKDYLALAQQCCQFSLGLLDECRTSKEQRNILNYPGEEASESHFSDNSLGLVNCAIFHNQKEFVAHPFCQHLIMQHIFGDITGWRTSSFIYRVFYVITQVIIFPLMAIVYFFFPFLHVSRKIRRPLIKFINHTASFVTFLVLLAVSSHHKFGIRFKEMPSYLEWMILMWILGIAWSECIQVWHEGVTRYLSSGWNWMDMGMVFLILGAYIIWTIMILLDLSKPGELLHDIVLSTADGMYSFGVVASFFRLVYLCQISRYLGLLQLSLSRMVRVIFQFAFISCVMLASFSVAMTMLFMVSFEAYGKERPLAYNSTMLESVLDKGYHNLLTTMVTLMWASLDMVGLVSLEVFRGQSLIQFWSAALFTLYHAASMIVLLNMLIAMMSNSYQQVEDNIETEYKFARTQLWADYIGDGVPTLPPPINLIPTPKFIYRNLSKLTFKCFGFPRKEPCLPGHQFRVYVEEGKLDMEQKKQDYKNTVRELLNRYWARRRKHDTSKESPDRLIAMHNMKDEVSDMLSEIRNILKSRGRTKNRERLARIEETMEQENIRIECHPQPASSTSLQPTPTSNHIDINTPNDISQTKQDSNHNIEEASADQDPLDKQPKV
ncbi:short transient receptor potential channel 4-like isoform X2 [Actinia tenebrosa]|uniref:Short transient receptor potential channel 4-like isoform X2 n=1 Tax=Actinia tenebrosa TaxID=6105 RepID=A0A6P8IZ66_ACTTE|nr:short transient receptor potential channel 4-like isoform X2 [Actinia tenebrosa]